MAMAPVYLLPTAVSELFAQVSQTRQITLADRFGLMAAAFDDSLTQEEREAINRILYGVWRGRFRIVDQLSAIRN